MDEDSKKNQEIELLKLEYQECQRGYSQRDGLAEDEFGKVVQLFLLLVATVFLFDRFAESGRTIHCLGCLILGIAGFFYFFSILVSIESNASCNVALRQRCEEIEGRIEELTGHKLQYWNTIQKRVRHLEEMVIKGAWGAKADSEKKERERNIFINTVRLLIVLWIIVLIVTIHPKITNKEKTAATSRSALIFKWDSSR